MSATKLLFNKLQNAQLYKGKREKRDVKRCAPHVSLFSPYALKLREKEELKRNTKSFQINYLLHLNRKLLK